MSRARLRLAAAATATVLLASPTFAQGKSQTAPGKSQSAPGKSRPPSASVLPETTVIAPAVGSAPFAWIDDATLLPTGAMVVAVSMMRWNGADVGETRAPIVDMAVGLAPRFQLSASVPHIVDATAVGGASGGLGTAYVSGKVGVVQSTTRNLRVAVLPTLEILGANVVQPGDATAPRVRWGVPVALEMESGGRRLYGGGGFFTPGVYFLGAGGSAQVASKTAVSATLSRAWASERAAGSATSRRNDLSGSASYALTPAIYLFGSVGHTFATSIENGAGSTISAGVSFFLPAR